MSDKAKKYFLAAENATKSLPEVLQSYADDQVKQFLVWLSKEPDFDIEEDEVEEILQDWKYYNK